jgi:hypothetical protein
LAVIFVKHLNKFYNGVIYMQPFYVCNFTLPTQR